MRRGFTLIELVIAVVIIGLVCIGGCWSVRGCGAQVSDNLIVNPLHSSTAQIKVLTTYFGSTESGNIYRVYATVVQDSDAGICGTGEEHTLIKCPEETFEIEDSFIDGNYRTADLFGMLTAASGTDKLFQLEMRGERSGISGGGRFRMIHSVVEMGTP